jgi:hypothetical protein
LILTADFRDTLPELSLYIQNPTDSSISDTLFRAALLEWEPKDILNIKYHLWDKELRLEFSHRLQNPSQQVNGVRFLADSMRSVQLRWTDIEAGGFWDTSAWAHGAILSLVQQTADTALAADQLSLFNLSVIVGDSSLSQPVEANWCLTNIDTSHADSSITDTGGTDTLPNLLHTLWSTPVQVFPNPNTGVLYLQTPGSFDQWMWRLYDVSGRLLEEVQLSGEKRLNRAINQPAGMYLLELTNQQQERKRFRLVRE